MLCNMFGRRFGDLCTISLILSSFWVARARYFLISQFIVTVFHVNEIFLTKDFAGTIHLALRCNHITNHGHYCPFFSLHILKLHTLQGAKRKFDLYKRYSSWPICRESREKLVLHGTISTSLNPKTPSVTTRMPSARNALLHNVFMTYFQNTKEHSTNLVVKQV